MQFLSILLQDILSGCVQFQCSSDVKHDGIYLTLEGVVNLQLGTGKSIVLMDAFYNSLKPIVLLNSTLELSSSGRLSAGISEFHFEYPLQCKKEPRVLYETYHGVYININYQLRCDVKRNFLAKSLQKVQQFCLQYKPTSNGRPNDQQQISPSQHIQFTINPESLLCNVRERITIPRFLLTGYLVSNELCVTQPLEGQLTLEYSEIPIKSIELQLLRVETCGSDEGFSKDTTEIQTIQIADGHICTKLNIPIYMLLPRLFTCPTLITKNFKIGNLYF